MRALRSIPTRTPRQPPGRPTHASPRSWRPTGTPARSAGGWRPSRLRRVVQQLAPEAVDQIATRMIEILVQRFTTHATADATGIRPAGPVRQAEQADEDGWLRGAERIAAYLDCPRSRVYALASAGRIAIERDGSALIARKSDLDAWIRDGGGRRP
jgi:excisionase family DNA binding protein